MKSFRMMAAILALTGMCLATGAQAATAPVKTVTFATDAVWPPMEMVDANKNIVGFDIDFMNAVGKEAGFKAVFKNTAWDGIFAGVEAGQYDAIVSSVTITEERKAKYDFSTPYAKIGQVLVVPKAEKAKSLADMKGKKIGAQIGTTGAMEVKNVKDVELKTYDDVGLAFEDLAAGRIAGVVCDEPPAVVYAMQKKEYNTKFKIAGKPFTKEDYGVVVKKGNKELLAMINKGIAAVKKKKIDEQLKKKWLKN